MTRIKFRRLLYSEQKLKISVHINVVQAGITCKKNTSNNDCELLACKSKQAKNDQVKILETGI